MGKRADFGSSWVEFVANWCSGVLPSIPSDQGWRAIDVLARLWPEYIDKAIAKNVKGIAVMVPMIDLGITLEAIEYLKDFHELLYRMKAGERAAFSEAQFAAALVKLGYVPVLGPFLKGKRLDAVVSVECEKAYIEVISPEKCNAMKAFYCKMQTLTDRIKKENSGMDINIYLIAEPTLDISDAILNHMRNLRPSPETVHKLQDVALIKYNKFGANPVCSPSIRHNECLPELFVVNFSRGENGVQTRINVSASITDERAEEMIHGELHHFSTQERNILVMDLSSIPAGLGQWGNLIQRRFQPSINRRLGAVVLFTRYFEASRISWRCSVLENKYAYKRPPKLLLKDLRKLNESEV